MILTFYIILALFVGSFLNVCIYRIPLHESIVFPASHCADCGHKLRRAELIPLLSYLFLRGSCSHCHKRISVRYPIVEASNALLWTGVYLIFGLSINTVIFAALSSVLLVIAAIDLDRMIIPDELSLAVGVLAALKVGMSIIAAPYAWSSILVSSFLGLALGGGVFLAIMLITGAMGDGDCILMAALGFMFGWRLVLLCVIASFIIGAVISVFLLIFKVVQAGKPVPFAPYICLAAYTVTLFGDRIINWYLTFF